MTLEVAALITENGVFNNLPQIDLVALQNGIQENCFFLHYCAQVLGRHQNGTEELEPNFGFLSR